MPVLSLYCLYAFFFEFDSLQGPPRFAEVKSKAKAGTESEASAKAGGGDPWWLNPPPW